MKHRCQCPKPKYQVKGTDLPEEWQRKLGTILHFRKSITVCEKCGVGLCEDCREPLVFTDDAGRPAAVSTRDFCANCVSIFGESLENRKGM